jgi:hypothetical protein
MAYSDGTLLKSNDKPEVWLISGTAAFVTDNQGIIRWTSPLFRVGVNPQGLSGQTVVSYNSWNFNVPETIADSVFGFGLAIGDSPDNLRQIMNNSLGAVLSTLTPLVSAIGAIFAGSKKPSSSTQAAKATTSPDALSGGWGNLQQALGAKA